MPCRAQGNGTMNRETAKHNLSQKAKTVCIACAVISLGLLPMSRAAEMTSRFMTLKDYSPAIDYEVQQDIIQSDAGQYLGTVLSIIAQGGDGERRAKILGSQLSGKSKMEIRQGLINHGYRDVVDIVTDMSQTSRAAMAVNGYRYIERLKFWRAATIEKIAWPTFMELTAGYRRGRTPNPANLDNEEMAEILGALGIARGAKLNDSEKVVVKFASHFNLANGRDREAFAQALVAGCEALKDYNLALRRGMSTDAVFNRIKNIAVILAMEMGTPEAAIVKPVLPRPTTTSAKKDGNHSPASASSAPKATLTGQSQLAAALAATKHEPNKKDFEALESVWEGLPPQQKAALQKSIMWAFCAMLLAEGDTSELAKRMKYISYQELLKAVSDACQTCGGDGRVEEMCGECKGTGKCPSCHGTGKVDGMLTGRKVQCPRCNGTGRCPGCTGGKKEVKCRTCTGSGHVQSKAKCLQVMNASLDEALRACRKEK